MSPTQFSLRNPLVVAGVAVALCLFGLFAYTRLGSAIPPNVNVPQAVVTTTYPGADPATVEANVTRPIEDAIAALPNIDTKWCDIHFGVRRVRCQRPVHIRRECRPRGGRRSARGQRRA